MSKPLATVAGLSAGVAAGWLLRSFWQRDDAQNKPAVNNDAAQKKPPVNVRVGVGVVVRRRTDGKILVGERHGSHGANKVAFPGGHLEMQESWDECARREVLEETGLALPLATTHIATTNDPMPDENKHYITIFMRGDAPLDVEPQNLEPHKCKGWSWMSFDEIKAIPDEKLFIPFRHFIKYAEKHSLFDDNDKTPRRLKRGDTDKSHVASVAESVAKLEQVVAEGGSRPTSPAPNLNASTPGSA